MKYYIRLFLIALVSLSFGLSCGGGGAASDGDGGPSGGGIDTAGYSEDAISLLNNANLPESLRPLVEASKVASPDPTTIDLIDQAENDGTLDEVMARIYRIYAYLRPEKVPEQYVGADVPSTDIVLQKELPWLADNIGSLDAELQAEVQEFVLPPDDPGSYFYSAGSVGAAVSSKGMFSGKGFVPAVSGKVEVEQHETETITSVAVDAINAAWPKMSNLLGLEIPRKVIVLFRSPGIRGALGLARDSETYNGEEVSIVYIVPSKPGFVPEEVPFDKLVQSVAVHELTHLFLYAMPLAFEGNNMWLHEAISTYSQDYVLKDNNLEQDFLQFILHSLSKDLIRLGKGEAYGSYLWFFFLEQYLGDASSIGAIVTYASSTGIIEDAIINNVSSYYDAFPEYGVYNFNYEDYHLYSDDPEFPRESTYCNPNFPKQVQPCVPGGDSVKIMNEHEPREGSEGETLEKGAIKYMEHYFVPPEGGEREVKQVTFSYVGADNVPYTRRLALLHFKDGHWEREDWTAEGTRSFCLTKSAEAIDAAIVILSNSDLYVPWEITYEIETLPACESGGYTRVAVGSLHFSSSFLQTDKIKLTEEYEANDIVRPYVLTSRSMTYLYAQVEGDFQCSGVLNETYTDADDRAKLWQEGDGTWRFNIFPDEKTTEPWVYCSYESTSAPMVPGDNVITLTEENFVEGGIKGHIVRPVGDATLTIDFEYTFE